MPSPVTAHQLEKKYYRGTHRLVPPEATWGRISPLLGECGITRIADVTRLDEIGVPVFQAIRPNAFTLSVSQGKGLTSMLARVSAAMEGIELDAAERFPLDSYAATARELGPLGYRLRDLPVAKRSLISDELVIQWVPGRSLGSHGHAWVPLDLVRLDFRVSAEWNPPAFFPSGGGLASGNCYEEAALHALYELVERDATAWLDDVPPPSRDWLDPDSVTDDDCRGLLDRFDRAGIEVEIYDATTELGVPCYRADIWSRSVPVPFSGSGSHLSPAIALCRALTEAAQSRLTAISGVRDDIDDESYAVLSDVDFVAPVAMVPGRLVSFRAEDPSTSDLGRDLEYLTERVAAFTGVEPIGVEVATPGHVVSVVRVIAPGLRWTTSHRFHRYDNAELVTQDA
jgi:ribosomal protein S12 methylthiotransferase accessory factor